MENKVLIAYKIEGIGFKDLHKFYGIDKEEFDLIVKEGIINDEEKRKYLKESTEIIFNRKIGKLSTILYVCCAFLFFFATSGPFFVVLSMWIFWFLSQENAKYFVDSFQKKQNPFLIKKVKSSKFFVNFNLCGAIFVTIAAIVFISEF